MILILPGGGGGAIDEHNFASVLFVELANSGDTVVVVEGDENHLAVDHFRRVEGESLRPLADVIPGAIIEI